MRQDNRPLASTRLPSVDVFRGATMAAMVIVNTPGDWNAVYAPLRHAEWHGWTPTDLIFPFFVFVVGVSIVLSGRRAGVAASVRRSLVLYGFGLLLALYPRFDFANVRILGVLPRLAICYLAAALIYRALADRDAPTIRNAVLVLAGVFLIVYWALLTFVPAPGGAAGDLSPSGNLGAWIDRTLLGEAHLWRQSRTWDPEGLLSTLPAIATSLTGVAAGIVLTGRDHSRRPELTLLAAGIASVALGLIWDLSFPINKNLWTSSYVLFTSGLAAIALSICHRAVDRDSGAPRWAYPFVVMGMNALALFVVSGWLVKTLSLMRVANDDGTQSSLYGAIHRSLFAPLAPPKLASLLFAGAALLVLYGLLEVMYRRRLFLRA